MKALTMMGLAGALLVTVSAGTAPAHYAPRQYYSSWTYTNYGYYFRTYYYKPYPSYTTYNYHYVIYYPQRPYYYYYNPYRRVYWGRSPVQSNGKEVYSLLKEEHRKGTLSEIKEEHFPKPGPMPKVPESGDGARMEAPPGDLPTGETLPKAG